MNESIEQLRSVWEEATAIWIAGGWAMIAIAVIALVMFAVGASIWLELRSKGFESVPEQTWRRWIDHPLERRGPIGEVLAVVAGGKSIAQTVLFFEQLRMSEILPFERDLRVMRTCVSAAPLVGLLGTVTGMLTTFAALSSGSGGEKTMSMVASGISEALITTETGLVVALPGLFFQYHLGRRFEGYKAFLAHVETVCTQMLHKQERQDERALVRHAARKRLATIILERLRSQSAVPPALSLEKTAVGGQHGTLS